MTYGAIFISGLVVCVMAMTMIVHHAPAAALSSFAMLAHSN